MRYINLRLTYLFTYNRNSSVSSLIGRLLAISEDVPIGGMVHCIHRIRGFTTICYINRFFTYLLIVVLGKYSTLRFMN